MGSTREREGERMRESEREAETSVLIRPLSPKARSRVHMGAGKIVDVHGSSDKHGHMKTGMPACLSRRERYARHLAGDRHARRPGISLSHRLGSRCSLSLSLSIYLSHCLGRELR